MPKFHDMTGKRYGLLTVLSLYEKRFTRGGTMYFCWLCQCDCGAKKICRGASLATGRNISCGCRQHKHEKHGYCYHPLYNTWTGMKGRCYDKNAPAYRDYGARGITVCDEWINDAGRFIEHVLSLGWYEGCGLSIDRINNNLGYSPSNVRLATQSMQSRNNRRTIYLEFNGRTASIAEWSEILGIPYSRIQTRIYRGWSSERALTEASNRCSI